jgi:hypothetical protein
MRHTKRPQKIQNNVNEAKPQADEANLESKAVSHEDTKTHNNQFTVFLFFVGFVAPCEKWYLVLFKDLTQN